MTSVTECRFDRLARSFRRDETFGYGLSSHVSCTAVRSNRAQSEFACYYKRLTYTKGDHHHVTSPLPATIIVLGEDGVPGERGGVGMLSLACQV